jgi:hypothetical protein
VSRARDYGTGAAALFDVGGVSKVRAQSDAASAWRTLAKAWDKTLRSYPPPGELRELAEDVLAPQTEVPAARKTLPSSPEAYADEEGPRFRKSPLLLGLLGFALGAACSMLFLAQNPLSVPTKLLASLGIVFAILGVAGTLFYFRIRSRIRRQYESLGADRKAIFERIYSVAEKLHEREPKGGRNGPTQR